MDRSVVNDTTSATNRTSKYDVERQTDKVLEDANGTNFASGANGNGARVRIWNRIDHFTFAWYAFTMATGGLALLLSVQPNTFNGLVTIGKFVFVLNIVMFILITAIITTRFVRNPRKLKACANNPTESLFIPAFVLSIATILAGIPKYGVPSVGYWLVETVRVLFWFYVALAFFVAVIQYWFLFTALRLTVQSMTPAWLLPIFPVTLTGTLASIVAAEQPPSKALPIVIAGATFQGLGFWIAILMYSVYIGRLMEFGLPAPNLRPGMFISVGPPAFTGLALIGLSNAIPPGYGYFAEHPTAIENLQQMALVFAIFIWSISFWFFCVSLFSCLTCASKMCFHLVWWAFIFPNTGLVISIIEIGKSLQSSVVGWVGSVLSILVVITYLFVFCAHVRAVFRGDIMWPGKDEDKDE